MVHASPKQVGWVRFPVGYTEDLWLVQLRARRWWSGARKQFTRSAAIDSTSVQHSLTKADVWSTAQASGNGRPKDHSWHSERNAKAEYNWTIHSIQSQATCHWPGSYRFEHERWPISVTWRKSRLFYGLAKNLRGVVPVRGAVWLRTAGLEQRSSTFAHGAP